MKEKTIESYKDEIKTLKEVIEAYKKITASNKTLFKKVLKDSVPVKTLKDYYKKQWL